MRALLLYPSLRKEIIGYGDLGAIAEPLALEYLAAGALEDSHEVRILDLRLHPDDLETTLADCQPDLVGLTGYSMHVLRNLALCRQVKGLLPTCWTVVGGHHATLLPEDYFAPQVDLVVCGEGVHPFREILRLLESGREVRDVPGVWSRIDGRFVSGGAPLSYGIDSIPPPDRTLTAGDRDSYFIDWMRPIALRRTAEFGISVLGGFIVNPSYTPRSFKQLIRFIEHNRVDYPSFTILTPLPGTDALTTFDEVIERQPNGRPNWELFDLQHPVTRTRLSREEFAQEYHNLRCVFAGIYLPHRPDRIAQARAAVGLRSAKGRE